MSWLGIYMLVNLTIIAINIFLFFFNGLAIQYHKELIIGLAIETIISSLLLNLWISRHLNKDILVPLEKLRLGAERIHHGDLSSRIDLQTTDDIGVTASALDNTAQLLQSLANELANRTKALASESLERQKTLDELLALNSALDSRVRERTEELEWVIQERQSIEAELWQSVNRLLLLNRVIAASNTTHQPVQVLEILCAGVVQTLNLKTGLFIFIDEDDARLGAEYHAVDSSPSITQTLMNLPITLDGARLREMVNTQQFDAGMIPGSVFEKSIASNNADSFDQPVEVGPLLQPLLLVPMIIRDQTIGILYLLWPEQSKITDEEVVLAQNVTVAAGQAYDNASLNQAIQNELTMRQRIHERQTLLYDILRSVSGKLDIDSVARLTVDAIERYTDWPHICFAVLEDDGLAWNVRGAGGRLSSAIGTRGTLFNGIIGRAFRTQICQIVPNVQADSDYLNTFSTDPDEVCLISELAMPLLRGDRVLGVINLESNRPNAFNREDVQMIESLAEVVVMALDNARLYQEAQTELTERKRAENSLIFQSTHDYLTGLYNRTYFEEDLKYRGKQAEHQVSLIMMDLDTFKQINDTLGHSAGDECLKQVAEVLRTALGPQAVVARLGGDEFAAILPDMNEEEAKEVVDTIRAAWEATFPPQSQFGALTNISIGYAASAPGEKFFNALKRADHHMYAEKFLKRQVQQNG